MQAFLPIAAMMALASPLDRLEAEPGLYGEVNLEYKVNLTALLLWPHNYRFAQMLVEPARRPEEAVYLAFGPPGSTEDCKVVSNRMRKSLAGQIFHMTRIDATGGEYFSMDDALRKKAALVAVDRASTVLTWAICEKLARVWMAALVRVRPREYSEDTIEIRGHGDTFHFESFTNGEGYRGGSSWSPEEGTKMAALVNLANDLIGYARSPTQERERLAAGLAAAATRLLARLEETPLPGSVLKAK